METEGIAEGRLAAETGLTPAWLRNGTCLGLAAAVAVVGLAASRLLTPSPIDDRERQYVDWLRKLRAVEEICGRRVELNPECWRQHPLPPDPTGIWGR